MSNHEQQKSLVIVGAAIGDIVLAIDKLPTSGQDIGTQLRDQQVGGCAFNIARALRRLNLEIINGIPVGYGTWGNSIRLEMAQLGIPVTLQHSSRDNGWCIALVEPDGERTFISIQDGCENDWNHIDMSALKAPSNSIVYVSGYELVASSNQKLVDWLYALPDSCLIFFDPGPRMHEIPTKILTQLWQKNLLLTINQDEIAMLCGQGDPLTQIKAFSEQHNILVIVRLGSKGAWICEPGKEPQHLPSYQVDVVDSIGAGDCHCAGVMAGLSLGYSLQEAVRLGNKVAAVTVSRCGAANPPEWYELENLQPKTAI